jgi:hypothetical protein
MKNPFEKKDNSTLIVAIAAGALTAGVLAYLYLTESGASARSSISHKAKDGAKNLAAAIISDKTGIHKHTVKKVADRVVK